MRVRPFSQVMCRRVIAFFTSLLVLSLIMPFRLYPQSPAKGKMLFQQRGCTSCHTIGGGKKIGPDLKGITEQRDHDWLVNMITNPDKMIASDPAARQLYQEYNNVPMPNLGLLKPDAEAIIAYLANPEQVQAAASQPAQPTPESQPVDSTSAASQQAIQQGRALFSGLTRLQNGGPACISCHNISGVGAFGGGSLGPDLTQAFSKFGGPGLQSLLSTIPYPTMQPIFTNAPLTPQEQASLVAFLQSAVNNPPRPVRGRIWFLTIAGFFILGAIAPLAWRKRLRDVRKGLAKK